MNQETISTINIIKEKISKEIHPLSDILLLTVFGSQVRGTALPDSDLDLLFVAKNYESAVQTHNTISHAIRSRTSATILGHSVDTIKKPANLYGTPEYAVLRGINTHVILQQPGNIPHVNKKINYVWCAAQWLKIAADTLWPPSDAPIKKEEKFFYMYRTIDHLFMACLLHHHIKFPFTRNIHQLYELLPSQHKKIIRRDDIAIFPHCLPDFKDDDEVKTLTAVNMVKKMYVYFAQFIHAYGGDDHGGVEGTRCQTIQKAAK